MYKIDFNYTSVPVDVGEDLCVVSTKKWFIK